MERNRDQYDMTANDSDQLKELKHIFLSSLNHEIRTPLNGIFGLADLLLETKLEGDQKEYVESVRTCAEKLFEVLNATLEYSALSAGNAQLYEAEFRLEDTLAAVVLQHLPKAVDKGLKLLFHCDNSVPETAVGDAIRIREVLNHLLGNALKFTSTGHIDVEVHCASGERLQVIVADTGIGIEPARQAVIFEAFHQLDGGLAREYSGIGLGLAICQKQVQLLGGKLELESKLGAGSTFRFSVPLHLPVADDIAQPQMAKAAAASASAHHASVLVVEDNQVAQRIVHRTLAKHNYHVVSAMSGMEAIKAVESTTFDLILMDLQMPGMDGIEAAFQIRQTQNGKNTPIVAFTANSSAEYREMCRQAGFQGFLAKPVNVVDLVSTVDDVCMAGSHTR